MSEVHTAKVDIYFDYSDETFETYRVHEPAQAIEFVISGTGLRLLLARFYANGLFIDDKYSKGRQQVLFSKPTLISLLKHTTEMFYVSINLSLTDLMRHFLQLPLRKFQFDFMKILCSQTDMLGLVN